MRGRASANSRAAGRCGLRLAPACRYCLRCSSVGHRLQTGRQWPSRRWGLPLEMRMPNSTDAPATPAPRSMAASPTCSTIFAMRWPECDPACDQAGVRCGNWAAAPRRQQGPGPLGTGPGPSGDFRCPAAGKVNRASRGLNCGCAGSVTSCADQPRGPTRSVQGMTALNTIPTGRASWPRHLLRLPCWHTPHPPAC